MMPFTEYSTTHFSGRKSEIDILRTVASDAVSGISGSILLSGKRGIGKTELLKQLFGMLFNSESKAIPFMYTINTAVASPDEFARDYLSRFIHQSLAFLRKDTSFIPAGPYSLEDLKESAERSGTSWVVDMINSYLNIREADDPVKLVSFALSSPYQSYRSTGRPVVVIIDDFHKIRKLSENSSGSVDRDLWMCFDSLVQIRHTPHILAGSQQDLYRMFFEETSFGEHLELFDLQGLNSYHAFELFTALCSQYSLDYDNKLKKYIDLFGGNPFYIKSFVQASRHSTRSVTEENFWDIYIQEVTKGKISTYWTSVLKSHIRQFDLRKPALHVLYNLSVDGADDVYAALPEMVSAGKESIDSILDHLYRAGAIERGFTTIEPAEDRVLSDVIKGLYHREILKDSLKKIKDTITEVVRIEVKQEDLPAFEITVPPVPKAELIVVQSLEHIAGYHNLPPDVTGQLQVCLVELFSGLLAGHDLSESGYRTKVLLKGNRLSVEILTSRQGLVLTDEDSRHMRAYVDDIKIEETVGGSRIVLYKELKEDIASVS